MKGPITLIVSALLILGSGYFLVFQHDWVPLEVPVRLAPGDFYTPQFQVDSNISYEIQIQADRTLLYEQLGGMLGFGYHFPDRFKSTPSVLEIAWVVVGDDGSKQAGRSNDCWGLGAAGDKLFRNIGVFEGKRGQWYHLELNLTKDATALAATHPKLVVIEHSHRFTAAVTILQFLAIPGLLVGTGGLIWLVVVILQRIGSRRKAVVNG